jgi:amino acid adenylation domain-containing protein
MTDGAASELAAPAHRAEDLPGCVPTNLSIAAISDQRGAGGRFRVGLPLVRDGVHPQPEFGSVMGVSFVLQLGAVFALLYRCLDQDRLTILMPTPGPGRANDAVLVGVRVSGSLRFDELAARVSDALLTALANDVRPLAAMRREFPMSAIDDGRFLSDVACVPNAEAASGLDAEHGLLRFEFDADHPQRLDIAYDGRWAAADVERLAGYYIRLFAHASTSPETVLDDLPLLSVAESRQQIEAFNATSVPLGESGTIHGCFARQAEHTPRNIAAADQAEMLSYAELDVRANRVAVQLSELGVAAGDVVAVVVPRSCGLLVSVLGVLKAGGAFLLIDPDEPPARIDQLLRAADVETGIVATERAMHSTSGLRYVVSLDTLERNGVEAPAENASPDDPAYIIFTSGTTGQPNAVQVSHRSFVNRMQWLQRNYELGVKDVSLQRSAYSFDPAICEMLRLLWVGGRVCFMPHGSQSDIAAVLDAVERYGVTVIDLVPSPLTAVLEIAEASGQLEKLRSLRWVFAGAETMPAALAAHFEAALHARFGTHLVNTWGATETTVDATWYDCSANAPSDHVPVGRPIDNCRAYVLTRSGNLLPLGLPGELCIAGQCLADGYRGAPPLTRARFVEEPRIGEARVFRSGDLARFRPQGDIEFLGRRDRQLKVRGVRIDPAEIEQVMREYPAIRDAVVRAEQSGGGAGARLVAYAEIRKGASIPAERALRDYLSVRLPSAIIPDRILTMIAFPRTAHDKINEAALEALARSPTPPSRAARAGDDVQTALMEIVEDLLARRDISQEDDFFAIGGQSLAALRLSARVQARFGVRLSLRDVFACRTLDSIAARIRAVRGDREEFDAITRVEDSECFETSHAQRRFWALSQSGPGPAAYNVLFSMLVAPCLDRDALQQAMDRLVACHEILRTTFCMVDGILMQEVHEAKPGGVRLGLDQVKAGDKAGAFARLNDQLNRPFDLENGPLLRAGIIRIGANEDVFFVTIHHIVVDAWSLGLMLRELFTLYARPTSSEDQPSPPSSIQYRDFAHWQNARLRGEEGRRLKRFWTGYLRDAPILDLLPDRPTNAASRARAGQFEFVLDEKLAAACGDLARANNASLFMLLLAALATIMSRRSGQDDLIIGTPVSGRPHVMLEDQLGCFVNPLALRVRLRPDMSFIDLLRDVRHDSVAALDAQDYPFDLVVADCGAQRGVGSSPLFNVMLVLQNAPDVAVASLVPGAVVQPLDVSPSPAKLDMIMTFEHAGGALRGMINYNAGLFFHATIASLACSFQELVRQVTEDSEVRLFPENSRVARPALPRRKTATDTGREDDCLHRFLERQVDRTPLRIATMFEGRETTYRDLNETANALAHCLREEYGVGRGEIVAVPMERTDRSIVMELAILKAGAAFLPIDRSYPIERLCTIFEESCPSAILLENDVMPAARSRAPVIRVDQIDPSRWPCTNPPNVNGPDDPAYVVYTSGSTGRPKGVVVNHRSICSLLRVDDWLFDFDETDIWSAFHSVSFDFSVWEVFMPLSRGAKVVFVPRPVAADPNRFAELLATEGVTVLSQVPSAFAGLSAALRCRDTTADIALRWVVFGGEPINIKPIAALREKYPRIRFVNGYGISETTILSTFKEIENATEFEIQSIGSEIGNQSILLLDAELRPVTAGAKGEICVEGPAVARGYLNRPDLTARSFVSLPDGRRIYRSGDLARRTANGELIYLGRSDSQVKVRGFRVELDEIRHTLLRLEKISDAVVIADDGPACGLQIVAYVKLSSPTDIGGLREQVSSLLPDYMMPGRLVAVDRIPLDANGKADRRRLKEMGESLSARPAEEATRTQRVLVGIFEEVLGVRGVRIDDDFFGIGGHSLGAVHLASRIAETCATGVSIDDIFRTPTVRSLADQLDRKAAPSRDAALASSPPADSYRLSPTQETFWLIEHFREPGAVVEAPTLFELEGRIDPDAGAAAMAELFATYEILRTRFELIGDTPRQVVSETGADREAFRWTDLSRTQPPLARLQELYDAEAARPFDLEHGPLFRLHVVRIAEERHAALCTVNHIISDGSTQRILLRDWRAAHDAQLAGRPSPLEAPAIQYRAFSEWQHEYLGSAEGEADVDWWARELSGRGRADIVALWPGARREFDRRPNFYARAVELRLDATTTAELKDICRSKSATLFMGLNAVLRAFLHIHTGLTDLVIGSPFEHRLRPEIKNQPGPFVNVLPLRTPARPSDNLLDLLDLVRSAAISAHRRSLVPTDRIARRLGLASSAGLMDVGFTLQSSGGERSGGQFALVEPERLFGLGLPLWFDACKAESAIDISVAYDETRFDAESIRDACSVFEEAARWMIARPHALLYEIAAETARAQGDAAPIILDLQ